MITQLDTQNSSKSIHTPQRIRERKSYNLEAKYREDHDDTLKIEALKAKLTWESFRLNYEEIALA